MEATASWNQRRDTAVYAGRPGPTLRRQLVPFPTYLWLFGAFFDLSIHLNCPMPIRKVMVSLKKTKTKNKKPVLLFPGEEVISQQLQEEKYLFTNAQLGCLIMNKGANMTEVWCLFSGKKKIIA